MDMRWYWRRISLMSPQEIGQKTLQRVAAPVITRRLRKSKVVAELRGDAKLPFESAPYSALFHPAIIEEADRFVAGKRRVLGLGWIPRDRWDWHTDPGSGYRWPLIPSYRLDYRKPGTEIRLCWELNRMHELLTVAQAWYLTKLEKYGHYIVSTLAEWERVNPVGLGPNWVSAMEAAIRIVNLTWIAKLTRDLTSDHRRRIGRLLPVHIGFIEKNLSTGSSANNHLLLELMGLVYGSAFWNLLDGEERLQRAAERYVCELIRQTGHDGMNREMSSCYHLLVCESAVHVSNALNGRRDARLSALLAKMKAVIAALTAGEDICRFGDDGGGHIILWAEGLPRWEKLLIGLSHNAWIGMIQRPPFPRTLEQVDGIVVISVAPFRVVVKGGEFGLGPLHAHAHDDGGSIYAAVGGTWLVVDPGTGAYHADPVKREYFRRATAHNFPHGHLNASETGGAFLWNRPPEPATVAVTADYGDVITVRINRLGVTRIISCEESRLVVYDSGPVQNIRLTLAPQWSVQKTIREIRLATVDGLSVVFKSSQEWRRRTGSFSSSFGSVGHSAELWYGGVGSVEWSLAVIGTEGAFSSE